MTGRNGILSLSISDKQVLHNAYMPFLINGGLFISIASRYQIGSEVFLIIKLMGEPEKIALLGKVVWITPARAVGARSGGFGIQFRDRESIAKIKIERLLEGQFDSSLKTQTF